MSFSNPNVNAPESSNAAPFVVGTQPVVSPREAQAATPFVDRRSLPPLREATERRQFGSSHSSLSEAGRELALAIDKYKVEHHRRYITCDEMLAVLASLGYGRS